MILSDEELAKFRSSMYSLRRSWRLHLSECLWFIRIGKHDLSHEEIMSLKADLDCYDGKTRTWKP